jgi:hypothetical protein
MSELREKLEQLYFDGSKVGSYSGATSFFRAARRAGIDVSRKQITDFLKSLSTYTQYRALRKKFPKRKIIPITFNREWQGDLADVSSLAPYNDNVKYLLFLIDIFSRQLRVVPLKSKNATSLLSALKQIFEHDACPTILFFDHEGCLETKEARETFERYGIQLFHGYTTPKAAFAERVVQTIMKKLSMALHKQNNFRYIEILPKLVSTYNETPHSALKGIAPNGINSKNEKRVWELIYRKERDKLLPIKPVKCPFKKGTHVRISRIRSSPFEKASRNKNFSTEVFVIKNCVPYNPSCLHELATLQGEILEGKFYKYELVSCTKPKKDEVYLIDKILKKKKRGKELYYLVRWKDFGVKDSSWVKASDIVSV